MGKAASYIRRSQNLDHKLRATVAENSTLVCTSEQEATTSKPTLFASNSNSRNRTCLALGICVCTKHPDAGFLFANLVLYFKSIFWKKKKHNLVSPQRLLLENHLAVLEFKQIIPPQISPEVVASNQDEWGQLYSESVSASRGRDTSIFLHIGRVDFRSWHFGTLQMYACESVIGIDPQGTLFLHPPSVGQDDDVRTDLEAFVALIDSAHPCTLRMHEISMKEEDWLYAPAHSIAVRRLQGTSDFMFWQGSVAERSRRKKLAESKRGKRPTTSSKPTSNPRPKKAAKKKKNDKDNTDNNDGPILDDTNIDQGGQSEIEVADENDFVLQDLLLPPGCEEGAGAYCGTEEDDLVDLDLLDDVDSVNLDLDKVDVEKGSEEQILENEDGEISDGCEERLLFAGGSDSDVEEERPAKEQQDVGEIPVAEPAAASIPRHIPAGITRSTVNRTVFEIPHHGELHFYHLSNQMIAFCKYRNSSHCEGCRKQMTTAPQKRGSGRPIRALVAWLMKADNFDTRAAHVHCSPPTLEERKAGRNLFEGLPDHESFSKFEKKKNKGDDSEPKHL